MAGAGGAATGRPGVAEAWGGVTGAEGAGASAVGGAALGPGAGEAVAPGADGAAVPGVENEPGLSSDAVDLVPAGSRSHVTMPAFTTITAPATQGQSRRRIGGRTATGWRWIVASVGTFAASCRFCSAFLRASRI